MLDAKLLKFLVSYRDFRRPEADAASISVSLMTARESYGRRLSFQEF